MVNFNYRVNELDDQVINNNNNIIEKNGYHNHKNVDIIKEPNGILSFDEALDKVGRGRFSILIVIVTGLCLISVTTENINVSLILPAARCDMKFTTAEQGLLTSVGFIGLVLSSHFWGFLADTWGRRNVLRVSLMCSFLLSILSALSTTTTMLTITRLCVGLFASGSQASAFSYVGEFFPNANRGQFVTYAAMFIPLTIVYTPLLALLILPDSWAVDFGFITYTPWRLFIMVCSCVSLISFILIQFLPESPKFLMIMGHKERALEVLRKMYSINQRKPKDTFPVKDLILETTGTNLADVKGACAVLKLLWEQTWPLIVPPLLKTTLVMWFLIFTLYAIAHGLFMWLPTMLTEMFLRSSESLTVCQVMDMSSLSESTSDNNMTEVPVQDCAIVAQNTVFSFQVTLVSGVIFAVVYCFMCFFMDRIGRRLVTTCWLILATLCGISIIFSTNQYASIVLFVIFLSVANVASILTAVSVELYPTHIRSMAICMIQMFGRIGGLASSNLVGYLFTVNCQSIFYIYNVGLAASAILCFIITKKRPSSEHLS